MSRQRSANSTSGADIADAPTTNGRDGTQRQTYTPRRGGGTPGKPPEDRPPGGPNQKKEPAQRPVPPDNGTPPPGDRSSPRKNPDQGGGPRKPWIQVHGAEIDADHDATITSEEFLAEAKRSFTGYDRNGDGKLTAEEYAGPGGVRSPMGGFIKEHAADIDSNKDATLTFEEFSAHLRPMFEKQDRNRDGKLTPDEWRDLPQGDVDQPPRGNRDGSAERGQRPPRPEGGADTSKPRRDPKP
jgi:hypothetical protein